MRFQALIILAILIASCSESPTNIVETPSERLIFSPYMTGYNWAYSYEAVNYTVGGPIFGSFDGSQCNETWNILVTNVVSSISSDTVIYKRIRSGVRFNFSVRSSIDTINRVVVSDTIRSDTVTIADTAYFEAVECEGRFFTDTLNIEGSQFYRNDIPISFILGAQEPSCIDTVKITPNEDTLLVSNVKYSFYKTTEDITKTYLLGVGLISYNSSRSVFFNISIETLHCTQANASKEFFGDLH